MAVSANRHELLQIADAVAREKSIDRTIVIITADHVEEFGEHGVFTHGNSLYFPVIHVPLLVRLPGERPTGRRVREAVGLKNLGATVVDLALGSQPDAFPGPSLRSTWSQSVAPESAPTSVLATAFNAPPWYRVATSTASSVVRDQYHFILWGDGKEELFDLDADPWETHNLGDRHQADAILESFRSP